MKSLRSVFPILCLVACVHATPPAPPASPPPTQPSQPPPGTDLIPAIRADVEALLKAQAEAFWKTLTGAGTLDIAATYQGRDRIFAPATLEQIKKTLESASGDERRALGYLYTFLVGELLARESAAAAAKATTAEATAKFLWDGKEMPMRQIGRLLAAEPNTERRAGLERAYATVIPKRVYLVAATDQAVRQATRKLGYPNTLAFAVEARGQPAQELAVLAEELLSQTDGIYRALMDELTRSELGVPLASSRLRDLPRLFYATHEPHAFPAAKSIPNVLATFEALGLALKKIPGLVLDLGARSGKSPRPIFLPVEVPSRIHVSLVPQGGPAEARAFLHELSAAVFYSQVTSPIMEFRRLGPPTIPETWALLFEGLAGDPSWLAERTGLSGAHLSREVRASAAEELHQSRLEAVRLLCELERVRHPSQIAEAQQRLLSRALARSVGTEEAARWPLEPDPLLHSAETIRARLLSAQAEAFLVKRASSPAWWRSTDNGLWLSRRWSEGARRSPQELSAALGQPEISVTAWVSRVMARAEAGGVTP